MYTVRTIKWYRSVFEWKWHFYSSGGELALKCKHVNSSLFKVLANEILSESFLSFRYVAGDRRLHVKSRSNCWLVGERHWMDNITIQEIIKNSWKLSQFSSSNGFIFLNIQIFFFLFIFLFYFQWTDPTPYFFHFLPFPIYFAFLLCFISWT